MSLVDPPHSCRADVATSEYPHGPNGLDAPLGGGQAHAEISNTPLSAVTSHTVAVPRAAASRRQNTSASFAQDGTTSQATATPTTPHAAPFFTAIYGPVAGWIELRAGVTRASDATKIDLVPIDQAGGWFAYTPAELPRLCADVAQLAAQYGNVYVSAHVYRRPNRAADVKPGRAILVEDAPLGLTCSMFVQTSGASGHAYYLLNQDAPADVLHDLSRRAAAALGGDASGADLQQLVRVPGTLNTKAQHGGAYPVTSTGDTGQRYSAAALAAAWPHVASASAPLDPASVAAWNGNRADLLNDAGIPRRWKNPAVPGWRVLRGDLVPPSTSEARYLVISSLVTHRYPDAEILVLARDLADFGAAARKGSAWLDADILRCSHKARQRYGISTADAQPSRTRSMQPAQPLPVVARAKKGRKASLTPGALLAFYASEIDAGTIVMLTVGEAAAQLQVSRSSIERCERVLRADGAIERRICGNRQTSVVAILRPVTIESSVSTTLPTDTATSNPAAYNVPSADHGVAQPNAQNGNFTLHEETHPLSGTPGVPAAASAPAGGCVPSIIGTVAIPAMWHGPYVDMPVTITGLLGTANGVTYVSVAESAAGIPWPEIELLDASAPAAPAVAAMPAAQPAAPASLTLLVRECFDAYPGVRITCRRGRGYLAMNAPGETWSDVAIDATLASERKARQQLAGRSYWDTLNAEITGLRDLPQSKLDALDRALSRTLGIATRIEAARAAGHATGAKLPRGLQRARTLWPHVVKEQQRRDAAEQAQIDQHGYCDAEQAAMLLLAQPAIAAVKQQGRRGKPQASVKAVGRVQQTQAGWALIGRLQARTRTASSA